MALYGSFSKRRIWSTIPHSPPPIIRPPPPNPVKLLRRELLTASAGFFRRILQRRSINNHSIPLPYSQLTLPVGEKLREKLKSLNYAGEHRASPDEFRSGLSSSPAEVERFRVGAVDVKRLLRLVKMEQIRGVLRSIPANTIQYGEFARICGDACGNKEAGFEFAKALDESGDVFVLGAVVFLRPDQVVKSMEKLISQAMAVPNDPRRKELEILEKEKASIEEHARWGVHVEMYCGLGLLGLQTLGFMRLTFWELSWDVMEPICFFTASFHFVLAYVFFLRTSTEPSFEGYFRCRFRAKQIQLMEKRNFDNQRYHELCHVFYPGYKCCS